MNINKQPDFEGFDGNVNYLIIEPELIAPSPIQFATLLLTFDDYTNDGDYMTLNGVKFTSASTIDEPDLVLTLPDRFNPVLLGASIDSLVSAINTNPILNEKYYAVKSDLPTTDVEVKSLYAGVKNIMDFQDDGASFVSAVFLNPDVEYETENYKNYKYKVEVFESEGIYPSTDPHFADKKVCELIKTPILKKETYFNLNDCAKVDVLLPTFEGVALQRVKRYYAKIKEVATNIYNIDQEKFLAQTDYFYQMLGAYPIQRYDNLNKGAYINTPVAGGCLPLTNIYKRKTHFRTDFNQKEFISFYNTSYDSNYNMILEVFITFTDGTTATFYKNSEPVENFDRDGKVILDISPDFIGLEDIETDENKTILKYSVAVVAEIVGVGIYPITFPALKYEILEECSANKVQLMFLNSLGGWDTHFFTGSNDKSVGLEQEFIQITQEPYQNEFIYQTATRSGILSNEQNLNSRYLTKEELEWLKDLLKSPQIYVINNPETLDNSVKPVNIKSFSYKWDSLNEVYVLDVVITDSYKENSILG